MLSLIAIREKTVVVRYWTSSIHSVLVSMLLSVDNEFLIVETAAYHSVNIGVIVASCASLLRVFSVFGSRRPHLLTVWNILSG